MNFLCFGSLNIDYVYSVDHILKPGETLSSDSLKVFCGGKGLNQSVAMAKAGCKVYHAGRIGEDGWFLLENMNKYGVDTSLVETDETRTGNAIIQVDKNGQNSILLFGGSNLTINEDYVDRVLAKFKPGDRVVLQNEITSIPYIIEKAHSLGLKTALNAAPMNDKVKEYPLSLLDMLIVNETEAEGLTGKTDEESQYEALTKAYPDTTIVLTLGEKGSMAGKGNSVCRQYAYPATAVDTTAAGDTFLGYLLASLARDHKLPQALDFASRASAVTVSRPGAADSIPFAREIF